MKNLRFISLALGLFAFGFAFTASAQSGTWSLDGNGNWGDTNNWAGYIVADGYGSTASFTFELTDARTVTNDSPRTIQNITFTDTASSHDLTISGTNTLTLAGGTPIIDVTQSDRTLTLSSVLSGSNGLSKAGPGTLTLSGVNTYTGTTTVASGTVKLQSTAEALPVSIGLVARWDAAAITGVADGSQLDTWADLSGSGRNATRGGGTPVYVVNGGRGMPVVRFTNDGNSYYTFTTLTTIQSVFFVGRELDTGSSINFCLGYGDGSGDPYHFHRGENDIIWHPTHTHANIRNGVTRMNGLYVNGTTTTYGAGAMKLLSVVTTGNVSANRIAKDRNIAGRSWRGDIGEILIYDRALTDEERLQVEQYLMRKWLGTMPATTAVTLTDATSRLDVNGVSVAIGSLSGVAGSQALLNGGVLTVGNDNSTTTMSGIIVDGAVAGGGMTKDGTGDLILAGDASNTYTGATMLQVGRLGLGKTGGAYAIPGNFIGIHNWSPDVYATVDNQFAPGAVMYFRGNSGDHVRFELLGTTQTLAGIDNAGGRSGYGVIQHREQVTVPAVGPLSTLILNGSGTYVFNGHLRGTGGTISLVKSGAGTQTLSGGNINYNGTTTVNSGELICTGGAYTGSGGSSVGVNSYITINNGTALDNRLRGPLTVWGTIRAIDGAAQTIGGDITLNGGALESGSAVGNNATYGTFFINAARTLTANGTGNVITGSNNTFGLANGGNLNLNTPLAGDILTISGKIVNQSTHTMGQIAKNGAGTVTLSAANTYLGATTVHAGTLTVNGSLANANMTITNGTVNGNGALHYRIAGAVSDLITVNGPGSITISGLTLNVVLTNAIAKPEYVIINDASRVSGSSFAAVNLPSAHWSVDYDGTVANPGAVVLLFNPDAALSTWDGETSGSWALGQNWLADTPLINGLPLVFPSGAGNKNNTNDLLTSALSLTLEGGYTISGSALGLDNSVNNIGVNELTLPLSLAAGARTFDVSGELKLSGAISGAGGISKAGAGTLTVSGVNTYTGATTVAAGTVKLQSTAGALPVSGAAIWLRADGITGLSDGASVTNWPDESGNARHAAQGTVGNRPLYYTGIQNGLPVVRFDGGDDWLGYDGTFLGNTDYTIFLVEARGDGNANYILQGTNNSNNCNLHVGYRSNTVFTHAQYANDYDMPVGGYVGAEFAVYALDCNVAAAAGKHTWRNGVALGSKADNTRMTSYAGARIGGNGGGYRGDVCEIIMYTRALSTTERQQVEAYLRKKWLGVLPVQSAVALSDASSILDVNGTIQNIGSLAGVSGSEVRLNGGSLTIGNERTSTTYSGVITDGAVSGGGIVKIGGGDLTLGGDASNTFTGATTLHSGRIGLAKTGGAYAIPGSFIGVHEWSPDVYATADNQFAPGAVMYFRGNSGDHVRFELLGTTQTLAGIDNAGGRSGYGVIQHREQVTVPAVGPLSTLILNGSGTNVFSGYLRQSSGTLSLVKSGTGMQTLSGGNITYNGATTVNAGTLVLQDTTGFASYMTMVPGSTLNLIRTVIGFSNRGNLTRLITGSGTINVNATDNTPGATDGGWVRFETAGTRGLDNFTGTVNVNSGNLTRDNVSTWSGNPTLNVYNNAFFGIRNADTSVDGLNGNGHVGNDFQGDTSGHTLTVGAANGSGAFSGVIHGSVTGGTDDGGIDKGILHFAKAGSGTQTLSGTNTYSGATTVRAGTLLLDFSAAGAPASNILLSGRSLVLAGGTLEIKGATGQNGTVQTFGNTTVNATSTLKLTQNGATTADLNLGALTSNGAGINFAGGTGTNLGGRFITTTSVGANDGQTRLLSCTWNGSEWASVKEVSGVKYVVPWEGSYTNIATGTESGGSVVVPNAPTSAVSILEGGTTGGPNQLEQATTTIGTLKMIADTTPATLRMNVHGANDTLVLGSGANGNGTVWVEEGAQALTLGQSAGQGFITAGSSGASTLSLVANNPDPERGITVHSRIQNNAGGGAVSLNVAGDGVGGTVVVTANNSYTGPTGIGGGTLQIAGTGSLGEGTYAVGIINNGLLRYSSSAGQTLSGIISGTGSLLKDTDASVLTLTGNNTYSGSTIVSNGTLKLQGGAFYAGARTYSIASGAVLNLDGTFNSSMPANSTTTITGAGTLRFTGGTFFLNNGAGGKNVAISLGAGGLIDVQSGSTLGNGGWASIIWSANLAALNVNGTVDVWDGNALYVDALTGNGVLTHTTYGSGQNITVGVNNGSGTFRGTITQQNASRITSLTKTGSGTQTLAGTNSYSGATTVSAGTLQIGDGGTTGTLGVGAVINNAALVFNRSNELVVTNAISGTGSLTMIGTGTLTLTATNTYTGATSVNGGTLRVNGALAAASAVTVTNAALAWMGTIYGSVTLNNGGKLLMDSSDIRTVGSLTLNEGSILDVSGMTLTGYEVPLLNYTSLTGTFTTLNASAGWKIDYNYNSEKIIALVKERGTMLIFQ